MDEIPQKSQSGLGGWAVLLLTFAFLYWFAVSGGPWLYSHIQPMNEIVQIIEENDINASAYYYTEIEEAQQGQLYLSQSLQSMIPEEYGITLSFGIGIIICLLVLYFGFRNLPD